MRGKRLIHDMKYWPISPKSPRFSLTLITQLAMLIAMAVALERLLGYNGKIISVSFSFIPVAVAGMRYGVLSGAIVGALADAVGALLFPSGPFNPWFTLVGGLVGAIYGAFLHRCQGEITPILTSQFIITLGCYVGLHTVILIPILHKGFWALFPMRALKNLTFFPIQVVILRALARNRYRFDRTHERNDVSK